MDKVYAHSLATRFARVADSIRNVFGSYAERIKKGSSGTTIEAFEGVLQIAGVILNSTCENVQVIGIIMCLIL